jgi:hypothetical protein
MDLSLWKVPWKVQQKPFCPLWLASMHPDLFTSYKYNKNLFHDLVFIPICPVHEAAFRHQSMRILCLQVHAPCYRLHWWYKIRREGVCTHNCDYMQFLLFIFLGSYSFVHILRFLFFCSYSLVDFQHQGKFPWEKTNMIDPWTIIWISSRWGYYFRGEFYVVLSSIIVTGATTGEGTSQTNKEASGSKDQASGNKNWTLLTFHPMYIINLNFSMHNMLMCNIISKMLHFQDLWWYSRSIRIYLFV